MNSSYLDRNMKSCHQAEMILKDCFADADLRCSYYCCFCSYFDCSEYF